MSKIGYCGDNCSNCPRYTATIRNDTKKLKETALMWERVGWRDSILSTDEIKCGGCKSVEWCRYNDIRECAIRKKLNNCGECDQYPCDKLENVFKKTEVYARECEKLFAKEDFAILSKAFFTKKKNLDQINKDSDVET